MRYQDKAQCLQHIIIPTFKKKICLGLGYTYDIKMETQGLSFDPRARHIPSLDPDILGKEAELIEQICRGLSKFVGVWLNLHSSKLKGIINFRWTSMTISSTFLTEAVNFVKRSGILAKALILSNPWDLYTRDYICEVAIILLIYLTNVLVFGQFSNNLAISIIFDQSSLRILSISPCLCNFG